MKILLDQSYYAKDLGCWTGVSRGSSFAERKVIALWAVHPDNPIGTVRTKLRADKA